MHALTTHVPSLAPFFAGSVTCGADDMRYRRRRAQAARADSVATGCPIARSTRSYWPQPLLAAPFPLNSLSVRQPTSIARLPGQGTSEATGKRAPTQRASQVDPSCESVSHMWPNTPRGTHPTFRTSHSQAFVRLLLHSERIYKKGMRSICCLNRANHD